MNKVDDRPVIDAAASQKLVKDLANGYLVRIDGQLYEVVVTGSKAVRLCFVPRV